MKQWKQFLWVFVATVSMILTPLSANAYTLLQCNNGAVQTGTTLFDTDANSSSGECQYAGPQIIQHIFSYVICDFVKILNDIMDSMYCGMNYYLVNIVGALLTLYLTAYGAQILMGTAQLSTKDAVVRMLKISFIYVFATQAAFGISFIFQFFMAVISTTSTAVLNILSSQVAAQNDGVCNFAGFASNSIMSMYTFFDYLVCHALLGPASQGNTRIQGFFLVMIGALPPMTLLFQWWLLTTLRTLVVTVVTFLKALAAIAFLVTLSPFFLGFFLFQSTSYVFENWLRYLISFSVQICIVIAIIVMWILIASQFVTFFTQLAALIYPLTPSITRVEGGVYAPPKGYAICPPTYNLNPNSVNEPVASCGAGSQMITAPFPDGPGLTCGPVGSTPTFDANPPLCTGSPLTCSTTLNIASLPLNYSWQCDQLALLPPATVINQGQFLYFVTFHLFTFLLITYCFSIMLEKADELARALAGPQSVPSLVPGWGNNLGNVNSFRAPPGATGRSAHNLTQDFSRMVGNR